MGKELLKTDKSKIREKIFLHLDGWAIIPTLCNLKKLKVVHQFLKQNKWTLKDLNYRVNATKDT